MAAPRPTALNNLARSRRTPRCAHLKANGLRCGSPALRGNVLCYFHDRWLACVSDDVLPPLEDGNGIQFSLMYVIRHLRQDAFRDGQANIPAVKQLVYALQTASYNLKHCNFDPQLASPTTDSLALDEEGSTNDRVPRSPSSAALDSDFVPPPSSAALDSDFVPPPSAAAFDSDLVPRSPSNAAFDSDSLDSSASPAQVKVLEVGAGDSPAHDDSHPYGPAIPTRSEIDRRLAARKPPESEPSEKEAAETLAPAPVHA